MKIPLFILSISILLIIVLLGINYFNPKPPFAIINNHVFSLYLAKTPNEQSMGLAKFNRINKDQGMLFIFKQPDYYSFWMKDMKFPIDIIFINKNKIVDIFKEVPVSKNGNLPVYITKQKADKVLEINSGLSNKYNLNIGNDILIKL